MQFCLDSANVAKTRGGYELNVENPGRRLVIVLRFSSVRTWRSLGRACHTIGIQLRAANYELRFRRMVRVRQQLGIQALRANQWRILVPRAMRNKCRILDAQRKFTLAACFAHIKSVFAHQQFHFEAAVLYDRSVTHFAPKRV